MRAQLIAALVTLVKSFAAAFLGQVIVMGSGVLDMGTREWRAAAAAGIAAAALVAYNALNPNDARYGIGA